MMVGSVCASDSGKRSNSLIRSLSPLITRNNHKSLFVRSPVKIRR